MVKVKLTTLAVVSVLLLVGLVTGVTAVAAQSGTQTAAGQGQAAQNQTDSALFDVDKNVRVTDKTYNEQEQNLTVSLENRGDARATVYLVQILDPDKPDQPWNFERFTLRGGEETRVLLEGVPDQDGDPAVLVATERSLEAESVEWITTGANPTTWVTLTQGTLIGIGTLGIVAPLMAWWRYTKPGSAPEDALKDDKGWF